jgi:hypothetical protein
MGLAVNALHRVDHGLDIRSRVFALFERQFIEQEEPSVTDMMHGVPVINVQPAWLRRKACWSAYQQPSVSNVSEPVHVIFPPSADQPRPPCFLSLTPFSSSLLSAVHRLPHQAFRQHYSHNQLHRLSASSRGASGPTGVQGQECPERDRVRERVPFLTLITDGLLFLSCAAGPRLLAPSADRRAEADRRYNVGDHCTFGPRSNRSTDKRSTY